jgi:tetratricopeptide (TPR) repeat protein
MRGRPSEDQVQTIECIANLAVCYCNENKTSAAQSLYEDAVHLCRKSLGVKNPTTESCINNLALFYANQGRYAEAERLYRESLQICDHLYGIAPNPKTAIVLDNLGKLYKQTGRLHDAEIAYKDALDQEYSTIGQSHPQTIETKKHLRNLYLAMGSHGKRE